MLHFTHLSNALAFSPLKTPSHFYSFLSHIYMLCPPPLNLFTPPCIFPFSFPYIYSLSSMHFFLLIFTNPTILSPTLSSLMGYPTLTIPHHLLFINFSPYFSPTYFSFVSQYPLLYIFPFPIYSSFSLQNFLPFSCQTLSPLSHALPLFFLPQFFLFSLFSLSPPGFEAHS